MTGRGWNDPREVETVTRLEAPDNNPHMALGLAESAACEPTAWERWIDDVEHLLGHSPDGDRDADGYSLDGFYEQWKAGMPAVVAAEFTVAAREAKAVAAAPAALKPDWEDDGRAGWMLSAPFDVECDPTGRTEHAYPPVTVRTASASWRMSRDDARGLAAALLAAADYR